MDANDVRSKKYRGRGATSNPPNRFEPIVVVHDPVPIESFDEDDFGSAITTKFYNDHTQTILANNKSPDVGFEVSLNPYRGCEHGCVYCYARPTHEYFGLSAGVDFESKIFVKQQAPALLKKELNLKKWRPQVIAISGVTDCYQPAERIFKLTRQCLEVLAEFKNPVSIITKNSLVLRDLDVLKQLAQDQLVSVCLSLTTLDTLLARKLEPRTSSPQARLRAVEELAKAGVPVGVNLAPMIPGLTDHEIPNLLKTAADAGAKFAGYVPLRLPFAVKDLFVNWLEENFPERKSRVLTAIRDIRFGELNDSQFGSRMKGHGPRADQLISMFKIFRRRYALDQPQPKLNTSAFRRVDDQLELF